MLFWHILLTHLKDAHTRIWPESSFKEETLNFKVINVKLGDQELWLAEVASLTVGFSFLISDYFSCVHFTIYIGNVREVFNPDSPSNPII